VSQPWLTLHELAVFHDAVLYFAPRKRMIFSLSAGKEVAELAEKAL
jgi:hypothetical protein